ncbi:hypothetical protein KC322_g119 [Hortaea werneckii]|nr:hypothetical protein KC322_g119 [Hortaea werneckii]
MADHRKIEVNNSLVTGTRSSALPESTEQTTKSLSQCAERCPSTPDIAQQANQDDAWEVPVQLDPSSFNILRSINPEEEHESQETVLEIPTEATDEMREIVESPPLTSRLLGLDTTNLKPSSASDADDELSALSVPSPGGFFSSLDSSVRRTWSVSTTCPFVRTAGRRPTSPPALRPHSIISHGKQGPKTL